MASVVKDNEEAKSQENDRDRREEGGDDKVVEYRRPGAAEAASAEGGFFHIYKSGQGYWTRMGTVMGALLVGGLTANFLYHYMPLWVGALGVPQDRRKTVTIAVIGVLFALYGLLVFWLINKPTNADFLIATDSEMKKVNWTSRKELIGSTKVVIVFMFLIAFMLFSFDIIFGYLFYFMGVLKTKPF